MNGKPPSLETAKAELQEHINACAQCQASHGKEELCSVGAERYGRLLAAWIPGPTAENG